MPRQQISNSQFAVTALCSRPEALPRVGSENAAEAGFERWAEAASRLDADTAAFMTALAQDPAGGALLRAVFGNSPFLTHAVVSEPDFVRLACEQGPDAAFAAALAQLQEDDAPTEDTSALMRRMRIAKRRAALAIGLADITDSWDLDGVIAALSIFAETALQAACAHLLSSAAAAGEIALPDPEAPGRGSGLIVLGMGKLGARELNYSSDIDLIILFDQDVVQYTGSQSVQQCFVRLARDLMRLMDERTEDGYVFRTDLRLRPDPGSTPLALSALAAETYYESIGQNWERAAMIKARPVAGDIEAGDRFLEFLRPFIWRKNLDFAAIQDIHSIKRQINAHRGGADIAIRGHNVKLGRGGIREIEFFAQTQQLIWGGRNPSLRPRATRDALEALVEAGRVTRPVADELIDAYGYLRRVEHRLQMVHDHQTHVIPDSEEEFDAAARFMGCDDGSAFAAALTAKLTSVERHYAELFEEEADLSGPGNLVFTGSEDDPDTLATLRALGFQNPEVASRAIRNWHLGRFRAMRSTRSRELLTELVPTILAKLAATVDPDAAMLKFDDFLRHLPAGVQLFSLFHANPGLLDLVAEIMGSAPRLADWLSRNPILLDGVLTHGFFDPAPSAAEMAEELDRALTQRRDFEDVLDITRRWTNDRVFQVGAHMLRDVTDPEAAGAPLSNIADVALRALFPEVEADFAQRHGHVPDGGMAVVALGKLGGREMTVASDLDLLLIYDAPDGSAGSDGERSLSPAHYYARLTQQFINAITAPTAEGKLYDVDMRLRPAGNAGPIATSLAAFVQYQESDAWTWEHMALTRARVVHAPDALAERINGAIRRVLTRPRDGDALLRDVSDMRARIAREHGTTNPWNIKHFRGGLVDIEFLAQYLQLRHAADHPDVLATNTTTALDLLAKAGVLDRQIANHLIATMHLWRRVQGIVRLSFGDGFDGDAAPDGLREWLARATGTAGFDALRASMLTLAERAHGYFVDLIERPAEDLPGTP